LCPGIEAIVAIVRVEPAGIEIDVGPNESVAECAWRLGFTWPTRCWGQAECMVCATRLIDGESQVEPPGQEELEQMADRLPRRLRSPSTRLACRLHVRGDGVVLEKAGVRPPTESS
jgi:2Fe-2S ferredoxin